MMDYKKLRHCSSKLMGGRWFAPSYMGLLDRHHALPIPTSLNYFACWLPGCLEKLGHGWRKYYMLYVLSLCLLIRILSPITHLNSQNDFPTSKATSEAKDKFLKSVFSSRSLRRTRDAAQQFSLVARGLEGSSFGYASVTM